MLQSSSSKNQACYPLYGLKPESQPSAFWHAKTGMQQEFEQGTDKKNEMYISFSDLEFNPLTNSQNIAQLKLLCTNHTLPQKLPFGYRSSVVFNKKTKVLFSGGSNGVDYSEDFGNTWIAMNTENCFAALTHREVLFVSTVGGKIIKVKHTKK